MQVEEASWQDGTDGRRGVDQAQVEALRSRLSSLPPPSAALARRMTILQAIAELRGDIESAMKKGWTIEMLAAELSQDGLDASPNTIRAYLSRLRKSLKPEPTLRRGARSVAPTPSRDR